MFTADHGHPPPFGSSRRTDGDRNHSSSRRRTRPPGQLDHPCAQPGQPRPGARPSARRTTDLSHAAPPGATGRGRSTSGTTSHKRGLPQTVPSRRHRPLPRHARTGRHGPARTSESAQCYRGERVHRDDVLTTASPRRTWDDPAADSQPESLGASLFAAHRRCQHCVLTDPTSHPPGREAAPVMHLTGVPVSPGPSVVAGLFGSGRTHPGPPPLRPVTSRQRSPSWTKSSPDATPRSNVLLPSRNGNPRHETVPGHAVTPWPDCWPTSSHSQKTPRRQPGRRRPNRRPR